jgi:hypothetical protein
LHLITETNDFWSGNLQTINYFDFQTLKKATKDFHPANLLGRGGFGPVYRVQFVNQNVFSGKSVSESEFHKQDFSSCSGTCSFYDSSSCFIGEVA